jgi:hypothetical protein
VVNIDADFPPNILAIYPYSTDVVIIYSSSSSFNIILVASNPPSEMRDYLLTKEFYAILFIALVLAKVSTTY